MILRLKKHGEVAAYLRIQTVEGAKLIEKGAAYDKDPFGGAHGIKVGKKKTEDSRLLEPV